MSDEDENFTSEDAKNIRDSALENADEEMKEQFDSLLKMISAIAYDEKAMATLREQIIKHYGERE